MIKTIAISAIKISPKRQRQEFKQDSINELSESIKNNGLFHAITLRVEGDEYYLVSGERRLKAITDMAALDEGFVYDNQPVNVGSIPYVTLGELDELSRREAEYDENTKRLDLTWQERAAATAELAAIRKLRAEKEGTAPPTTATIVAEVRGASTGRPYETTRRELIVAQHMHKPEVKEAKNLDEAWKALKRTEEIEKNRELAERVGKVFTADLHSFLNENALEWLVKCNAARYDVILTDPPYGMGADTFGDSGGVAAGAHGYEDTRKYFEELMGVFCEQSFRVAKAEAHAYVFCDLDNFFDLRLWMSEAGWTVFRTPFIWHKPNGMRTPLVNLGPYRRYELILFANKGKRLVKSLQPDVITIRSEENLGHAAQKPVALYSDLLARSVNPGDAVLDCFAGTGTIFPAAHSLKVAATGVELDPAAYAIGVKRIEALKAQLEMAL